MMMMILLLLITLIITEQIVTSTKQECKVQNMKINGEHYHQIYKYERNRYGFSRTVRNMLALEKLEEIHLYEENSNDSNERVMGYSDRDDPLVKRFLNAFDTSYTFLYDYIRFVRTEIKPKLFESEERILVQKTPNIRFHRPGETTLGRRDTDPSSEIVGLHRDDEFEHPEDEYNVIVRRVVFSNVLTPK